MPIDSTLLWFLLLATLCIDSMWGFTPYVVPAVAPSGAFRLESPAKHGFGRVCLRACLCGLKSDHSLHCAAHLCYTSTKDFHLLLAWGNGPSRDCRVLLKDLLVLFGPPLSTLQGHHMKQTCTQWRSVCVLQITHNIIFHMEALRLCKHLYLRRSRRRSSLRET